MIGNDEVLLDPEYLKVSEITLNDFLCSFGGIYEYYSRKWAESQFLHYCAEDRHDQLYNEKFRFYKEDGGSDKMAEAKAKSHNDVVELRQAARRAKLTMQLIYGYLRALDKTHENAINLGYNVRREMDKLYPNEIKRRDVDQATQVDASYFNGSGVEA